MYAMVDELVDFVFGGGGGGSDGDAVVFLFERLRNLYNQSGQSYKSQRREIFFTRSRLSRSSTTHRAH